jgi:phage shock protein PspC (stress-responsive transcriptional regulator)
MLMGVIAGLAEYFGISRWLLRLVIVAISLLVAFWPVLIVYVISAFIMPLEPNYY